MKQIIAVILASILFATPLYSQPTPVGGPPPASQAEVDAGTVNNKYVSPLTLNNWSGGGGGANAVTAAAAAGSAGLLWTSAGADRTANATNVLAISLARTPAIITITEGSPDTGTIDITKAYSRATIDEATTLTPSAAGTDGTFITLDVINSGAAAYTMTVDTAADFTFTAAASSTTTVLLRSNGSGWVLVGGIAAYNDLGAVTPTASDTVPLWDVSAGAAGKATVSDLNGVEKIAVFSVDGGGAAISTGTISGTSTSGAAYTLTGWSISATGATGTNTITIWNKAYSTAIPTVANVINTSGVSLTTGTSVYSTTLTDFTDTTFAAQDQFRCAVTAVDGTATDLTVTLYGTRL